MLKKILIALLICVNSYAATDSSDDASCVGYWPMEDTGNETNESSVAGSTLVETVGTIPQDADKKFGTYSRDFELDHT